MEFDVTKFISSDDLIATDSGLKYKVLQSGNGAHPTADCSVVCHYSGWLDDGEKFDCSYDRGKPATFPLSSVIKGWTEGVQLMQPGAKYAFLIPSELGYGERGAGMIIPPFADLVFVIELIAIK